jgi:hypothetical protein
MTSVAERVPLERIASRLNEILAGKCNAALPPDLQAEWDRLIEQRERDRK